MNNTQYTNTQMSLHTNKLPPAVIVGAISALLLSFTTKAACCHCRHPQQNPAFLYHLYSIKNQFVKYQWAWKKNWTIGTSFLSYFGEISKVTRFCCWLHVWFEHVEWIDKVDSENKN